MTVLVADSIAEVGVHTLTNAGNKVIKTPALSGDALSDALRTS